MGQTAGDRKLTHQLLFSRGTGFRLGAWTDTKVQEYQGAYWGAKG